MSLRKGLRSQCQGKGEKSGVKSSVGESVCGVRQVFLGVSGDEDWVFGGSGDRFTSVGRTRRVETLSSLVSWCRFPRLYGQSFEAGPVRQIVLHDLLLKRTVGLDVHGRRRASLVGVLDEGEAERTATVHVLLELGDGSLGVFEGAELDNTGTAGATVGLVLDLGALDLADSSEELDQVLVAGAPGQIADVDDGRRVHARSGVVRERVRGSKRSGRSDSTVASSARGWASVATRRAVRTRAGSTIATAAKASAKATTTSEARARAVATTTSESTVKAAATVAASEAATTTEAATATEATSAGKAVLANFEHAARPVVSVELLNGVLGILGSFESDDTRALGSAVGSCVNVSTDDGTALTEKVLQVLPANVVWEL